jgi:hypothetical protein
MAGRVESDAKSFKLPYDVLIGRDSDIIDKYQIVKLPRIIVIEKGGLISYSERFAPYDKLKQEVARAETKAKPKELATKPQLKPGKEAKKAPSKSKKKK